MPGINDKSEELKTPERKMSADNAENNFVSETEKNPEKKENQNEKEIVLSELRKEVEMMEVDEKTKEEAKKKAEKIQFLGEAEKVEHLLQVAREKGLVFAIQVARRMNEPYILDILHDTLAKEGFYKDFTK